MGSWYGAPPISSWEKPIGKMTAARQKKITPMKPIHLACIALDLRHTERMMRTMVAVTARMPSMTQTRARSQAPGS